MWEVDGVTVGGKVEKKKKVWIPDTGPAGTVLTTGHYKNEYTYEDLETLPENELAYAKGLIQKGAQGNVNNSNSINSILYSCT